jgi:hypothetical protein
MQLEKILKGGGVGFYINSDTPFKIPHELSPFNDKIFKTLSIDITLNKKT